MPLAAVNVGDSAQQGLDSFFGFLPNILGFLVILLIGYVIARIARKAIATILQKVGIDRALHSSDAGQYSSASAAGSQLRDRDSNPKFVIQRHACCQLHHPAPGVPDEDSARIVAPP